MAPCHIPGYRSAEYQRAFDELWALACHGRVTVEQVRQEMLQLRHRFGIGTPQAARLHAPVTTPCAQCVRRPP